MNKFVNNKKNRVDKLLHTIEKCMNLHYYDRGIIPKLKCRKYMITKWKTKSGNFTTTEKVDVALCLP